MTTGFFFETAQHSRLGSYRIPYETKCDETSILHATVSSSMSTTVEFARVRRAFVQP
ncbi:hypothetical protein [Burkholderia cenocepacia]|uniref:hypothetical protein n=1 Tax=Burkholderia cenocepacia TaxID=95486 RepID=UPI0013A5985A|nr:hypothetical protein [Burkholderia cenocepacia]MBR8310879.1 hypothetical protein [Burkholderia cenocepacia]HEM7886225.1 hypothetical protein [Burkholderia cenocepacia]